MTLMQGVRLYPKAVFWSMFISTCIIMEGYQLSLTNNFCKQLNVSQDEASSLSPRRCLPPVQQEVRDAPARRIVLDLGGLAGGFIQRRQRRRDDRESVSARYTWCLRSLTLIGSAA